MAQSEIRWRIIPLRTPHLIHACPRCRTQRHFCSTDTFRINRHQKRLDVWLIYVCEHCEYTWNVSIIRRTAQDQIPTDLYARFIDNDSLTAWRYAFDFDLLARNQMRHERSVPYRIEQSSLRHEAYHSAFVGVYISFEFPISIRFDTLLKTRLAVSQRQLHALIRTRSIRMVSAHTPEKLPKKIKRDCIVEINQDCLKAIKWS